MVDMGQADRSLRAKPQAEEHKMCWTQALTKAALRMGFEGYMDVPDDRNDELKALARKIQVTKESKHGQQ